MKIGSLKVDLVWFDSMGAKSSATLVETGDVSILIDPGAAVMQKGYPLPPERKEELRVEALRAVAEAAERADVLVVTHYHYDHHILPSRLPGEIPDFHTGKLLLVKNPNMFVNRSQWNRSRMFLNEVMKGKVRFKPPEPKVVDEVMEQALGTFDISIRESSWLRSLVGMWKRGMWVQESDTVQFADGKVISWGKTTVRFSAPMFHGSELKPVGWVICVIVEAGGTKLLYSSDIQGPPVDAYAQWIIEEDPDVIILDGPPTYLGGYRVKWEEIERALRNAERIARETKSQLVIFDHHLLREGRYRRLAKDVFSLPKVKTAAEVKGEVPLIDELTDKKTEKKVKPYSTS